MNQVKMHHYLIYVGNIHLKVNKQTAFLHPFPFMCSILQLTYLMSSSEHEDQESTGIFVKGLTLSKERMLDNMIDINIYLKVNDCGLMLTFS